MDSEYDMQLRHKEGVGGEEWREAMNINNQIVDDSFSMLIFFINSFPLT